MNKAYFWNKRAIVSYILAVLVFWIHCSSFGQYEIDGTIYYYICMFVEKSFNRVAVPLFFIISGALFFRDYSDRKYKEKLLRRVKTLVIPYLIWNTLSMLFNFFATTFFSQYFIGRAKATVSLKNVLLGIFHYKYNTIGWFLFMLIAFTVLSPLLDKLLYSKITSAVSIIALIVLCYFNIGMPQPLFYDKTSIIFYLLGGAIGKYFFDFFTEKTSRRNQLIALAVTIVGVVYLSYIAIKGIYVNVIIHTPLLCVFSISFWFAFDMVIPSDIKQVPEFLKHSFWVFVLHMNVAAVVAKLLSFVLPKNPVFCLVNFVLTTVLTLVFIEIARRIIKKISLPLYNLLSGSR